LEGLRGMHSGQRKDIDNNWHNPMCTMGKTERKKEQESDEI